MTSPEDDADGISQEVLAAISGRELLIQHLGYWPTFHDFEVIDIKLERAPWLTTATCDLLATFFIYDLGKAPDDPERKQAFAHPLRVGFARCVLSFDLLVAQ